MNLKTWYQHEQFEPGILGLFVNPFYFSRKELFRLISRFAGHIQGRILDVGCGQKPYKHLFKDSEYVGLEIDTFENRKLKKADCFYDGEIFPFQALEFDSIICSQVLEHVFNPDKFLSEIVRVLKADGKLLLTVPFVWDEHEQPFDFARYTSYGLRFLLTRHGFEVIELRKSAADVRTIFQMINVYLYKKTATRHGFVNAIITAILMSPFNILGSLLWKLLPSNFDLYLDNVVLARKKA